MEIKIKNVKIHALGCSYFVLVPMDYIKNGIVEKDERYDYVMKKAVNKGKKVGVKE